MAKEPATPKQIKVQVKYEDMTARYANQVILAAGQEELFLDFSSGIVPDPKTDTSLLPIHTRIAMTPMGVRRLHAILGQFLAKQDAAIKAAAETK